MVPRELPEQDAETAGDQSLEREVLPGAGGMRQPLERPASSMSVQAAKPLEELPAASEPLPEDAAPPEAADDAATGGRLPSAVDAVVPDTVGATPTVCLGVDQRTNSSVRWPLTVQGNPHLLIAGLPGMGKTTSLLNLCKQMVAAQVRPIVFSYHQDIDEKLVKAVDSVRFVDFDDGFGFHSAACGRPSRPARPSRRRGRSAGYLHGDLS